MTATELLRAGDLTPAIELVNNQLRQHPASRHDRTFLFELLCFSGDLERASTQLDILAGQDPDTDIGLDRYRSALVGENMRARFYTDGLTPVLPAKVPAYTDLHLDAIACLKHADTSRARSLLEKAEDCGHPWPGT